MSSALDTSRYPPSATAWATAAMSPTQPSAAGTRCQRSAKRGLPESPRKGEPTPTIQPSSVSALTAASEPRFEVSDVAIPSAVVDTTKQHEMIGRCEVGWREGMREVVESLHPELLAH